MMGRIGYEAPWLIANPDELRIGEALVSADLWDISARISRAGSEFTWLRDTAEFSFAGKDNTVSASTLYCLLSLPDVKIFYGGKAWAPLRVQHSIIPAGEALEVYCNEDCQ
jgi:hypothetical protein